MSRSLIPRLLVIFFILIAVSIGTTPSDACVGRKLVLGSVENDRQGMVVRILSILIHERTGTTVEVKFFDDREKLLDQVARGKVDLYIDHVEAAFSRQGGKPDASSPEERFRRIKQIFEEEYNLIWLKPMGYTGRDPVGVPQGAACAVVQKETLKKFPALPRLLEKIGTRAVLDDVLLDSLVAKGKSSKPASVARDYLKEARLI